MNHIDFEEAMSELARLIFSVFQLERRLLRTAMVDAQVVAKLAEDLPPAMLFQPNISGTPAV
eukprot:IDg20920t1